MMKLIYAPNILVILEPNEPDLARKVLRLGNMASQQFINKGGIAHLYFRKQKIKLVKELAKQFGWNGLFQRDSDFDGAVNDYKGSQC